MWQRDRLGQRLLTWIVNKISRTILKAGFVSVAFILKGKFVVSAFAMLLLSFMTDFAKVALATDRVRLSQRPEPWNIGGFVEVSVVLGIAMVAEALLLLDFCWSRFGFAILSTSIKILVRQSGVRAAHRSHFNGTSRRWFLRMSGISRCTTCANGASMIDGIQFSHERNSAF
jgi:hypothetical protein